MSEPVLNVPPNPHFHQENGGTLKGLTGIRQSLGDIKIQSVIRMAVTLTAIQTINANDYNIVAEAEAILADAALVSA